MIAFPDANVSRVSLRAFAPSKAGTSWWRVFPTREAALQAKAELLADGIHFKCKKVPANVKRSNRGALEIQGSRMLKRAGFDPDTGRKLKRRIATSRSFGLSVAPTKNRRRQGKGRRGM